MLGWYAVVYCCRLQHHVPRWALVQVSALHCSLAPCQRAWKSNQGWPKCLGPASMKTRMKLLSPGFGLAQPRPLWPFGECTSRQKTSPFVLIVCFSLSFSLSSSVFQINPSKKNVIYDTSAKFNRSKKKKRKRPGQLTTGTLYPELLTRVRHETSTGRKSGQS